LNINELPENLDLADYCRFAFIKITYSGYIDGEFVEKNIVVVMN
jgi:uncharacterized protein YifN (PemK superfamily)